LLPSKKTQAWADSLASALIHSHKGQTLSYKGLQDALCSFSYTEQWKAAREVSLPVTASPSLSAEDQKR